jgi:hypothetical protein
MVDARRGAMGRTIVVLALVAGCLGPSQNKRTGYLVGGAMVATGAGLVALSFVDRCERGDGLINNCDLADTVVITLGAIVGIAGLIKLGIELATPAPAPTTVAP